MRCLLCLAGRLLAVRRQYGVEESFGDSLGHEDLGDHGAHDLRADNSALVIDEDPEGLGLSVVYGTAQTVSTETIANTKIY